MKPNSYLQFPISALSYGIDRNMRFFPVMLFAHLHHGRRLMQKLPSHILQSELEAIRIREPDCQIDWSQPDQKALAIALSRLHGAASVVQLEPLLEVARDVEKHCSRQPFPLVRIRSDLWWKTFATEPHPKPISFREFCVLCAVYALIGDKGYVKASLERIRRLAAGIAVADDFAKVLADPEGNPNVPILSTRQVRTTLDNLEANRFFAKFTFNRGECFYSNRMNRAELANAVEKRKLAKKEAIAVHRALDRAVSQEIKARLDACSNVWEGAA